MGGSGGTDLCLRGVANGCVALARAATSMRRPRRARCIADGWRKVKRQHLLAGVPMNGIPRKRPRAYRLLPNPRSPRGI
jgi:ribosomal protein L34E